MNRSEYADNTETGEYHLPSYLALRASDIVEFSSVPTSDEDYAVRLVPVSFPSVTDDVHDGVTFKMVICAQKFKTPYSEQSRWGWVFLELHTKNWIGIKLEEHGAVDGEWMYMRIYQQRNASEESEG